MAKVDVITTACGPHTSLSRLMESLRTQALEGVRVYAAIPQIDEPLRVAREYAAQLGDRMVIVEVPEHTDVATARNRALDARATHEPAEFTAFLDDVDWVESKHFSSMVEAADIYHADLVVCGMGCFDGRIGREVCQVGVPGPEGPVIDLTKFDELAYVNPIVTSKLFRTTCLEGLRFERGPVQVGDLCYFFGAVPKLSMVLYTNEVTCHHQTSEEAPFGAAPMGDNAHVAMRDTLRGIYERYVADDACASFVDHLEAQIFARLAMGGAGGAATWKNVRTSPSYVRSVRAYLDGTMPDWQKNRFLGFGTVRYHNKEHLALKSVALMYRWGRMRKKSWQR